MCFRSRRVFTMSDWDDVLRISRASDQLLEAIGSAARA
jgi:hypothetical protein